MPKTRFGLQAGDEFVRSLLYAAGFVAAVFAAFSVSFAGCAGDDDDDDDDDPSFGEDIAGTYNAVMTTELDSCVPDNENADPVQGVIDIEQSKDLSVAWVDVKEFGPGEDWSELFKGDVYGTVVLKAGVETSPISGADCTKIAVQDYSVKVDLETTAISGRLSTNIFYMGAGCDSSNIDCQFEQVIAPAE